MRTKKFGALSPDLHTQSPHKGDAYHVEDWGLVHVQTHGDETDILVEFNTSSLKARRAALAFAQALVARVQEQQPGMRAEFIASNSHYHVRFRNFGSVELKAAHGLYAILAKHYE